MRRCAGFERGFYLHIAVGRGMVTASDRVRFVGTVRNETVISQGGLTMAELAFAVFSIGSRPEPMGSDETRPAVLGPLCALAPKYIPGTFSFSVTVGVRNFIPEDDHLLRLRFLDPSNSTVADTNELHVPKPEKATTIPTLAVSAVASLHFTNVELRRAGTYTIEVIFDSVVLGSTTIPVVKGEGDA